MVSKVPSSVSMLFRVAVDPVNAGREAGIRLG